MPNEIPRGGDALARGARSQTFAMGGDDKNSPIELRNVAPEGTPDNADIPSTVDNSAVFAKPEFIAYKGKPLSDRVLIKRIERKTGSLLVIPDSAQGKSDMGSIVSLGKYSQLDLAPGALILFDKYAAVGQELELVDENGVNVEHLLVQECDILLELTAYKPEPTEEIPAPCVQ